MHTPSSLCKEIVILCLLTLSRLQLYSELTQIHIDLRGLLCVCVRLMRTYDVLKTRDMLVKRHWHCTFTRCLQRSRMPSAAIRIANEFPNKPDFSKFFTDLSGVGHMGGFETGSREPVSASFVQP